MVEEAENAITTEEKRLMEAQRFFTFAKMDDARFTSKNLCASKVLSVLCGNCILRSVH